MHVTFYFLFAIFFLLREAICIQRMQFKLYEITEILFSSLVSGFLSSTFLVPGFFISVQYLLALLCLKFKIVVLCILNFRK